MLPPSRPTSGAHTPQPSMQSQMSDGGGRPRLSLHTSLSSVSSLPDLKKAGGVKRPRFVARASQYLIGTYGKPKEHNDYFVDVEVHRQEQPVPLEQTIALLQWELLANPLKPFGVEKNGPLLRILEGYMSLQTERDHLSSQLQEIILRHDRNVDMLEDERREWKQDEAIFRAEVKRLEILIAEGKTGLSQVALTRQQTLIRSKGVGRPRKSSEKSDTARSHASTASSLSEKDIMIKSGLTPSLKLVRANIPN